MRVVILNMESGDIRFLLETVVVTVDICYMVVYGKPGSKSYRNWSASPPIETNIAAMETKNLLSKKDFFSNKAKSGLELHLNVEAIC